MAIFKCLGTLCKVCQNMCIGTEAYTDNNLRVTKPITVQKLKSYG